MDSSQSDRHRRPVFHVDWQRGFRVYKEEWNNARPTGLEPVTYGLEIYLLSVPTRPVMSPNGWLKPPWNKG